MAGVRTAGTKPVQRGLPVVQLLAVCTVALVTANCANKPPHQFAGAAPSSGNGIDPKYGVRASKRLYNEGDVIPKGGGRRFSGKPYVVAGKTYVPREDARGYVREGLASWYGSAFHGRVTANGEVFDRHSIAAAHPTLPLPSYVRVTNMENGHSMILRVNDRGPYHANRLMDVSEEAARALNFHRKGTARVRVEYAGKASVAGSDDRKLLATLRTDGSPAAIGRAPVMMADLGPSEAEPAPERFERPTRALAFKPAETRDDDAPEAAPTPRPARPAPIVLASAPSVAVPAAVQPTAARSAPFRPAASPTVAAAKAPEPRRAVAEAARPAASGAATRPEAPLRLAPPPLRLTAVPAKVSPKEAAKEAAREASPARAVPQVAAKASAPVPAKNPAKTTAPEPASRMAAMPSASKIAIARLSAGTTTPAAGAKPAEKPPGKPQRPKVAGVY